MIDRKRAVALTEKTKLQARRQSEALKQNGLEGVWEVPSATEEARAIRLLGEQGITNITVKVAKPSTRS